MSAHLNIQAHWTPVLNIFHPFPLVGPEMEACYVEREDSPIEAMILALRPDRLAQKILFSGQRGSGKTSSMVRLAHQLSKDYLILWIDLHASLDLWRFSILDLLLAIGGGAYKVARKAGLQVGKQPWDDIVMALSTLVAEVLQQPDYRLDSEGLLSNLVCAVGDPAKPLDLGPDIPTERFSLGLDQVELESLRVGTVLREMVARVNAILAEVQSQAGRETLVIVDGLDKMEVPVVKDVFAYGSVLADLHSRAIYTVPYAFHKTYTFAGQEYFELRELPNIKLHLRGHPEQRYEPGYGFMRRVVKARLAAIGLQTGRVIEKEALDLLIEGSGGILRGLVRLFRNAVDEAEKEDSKKIHLAQAEKAVLQEQRDRSFFTGFEQRLDLLRAFDRTGRWQDEAMFLKEMHDGNIIVYEDEGRLWYAVHPLTRRLLMDFSDDSND